MCANETSEKKEETTMSVSMRQEKARRSADHADGERKREREREREGEREREFVGKSVGNPHKILDPSFLVDQD